ncbi:MAG: hypothetical protein IVW57_02555, partial [Ktedonobacterales bacterium]|nr:hypothetical protein [Ktedonobacterales bacterium]
MPEEPLPPESETAPDAEAPMNEGAPDAALTLSSHAPSATSADVLYPPVEDPFEGAVPPGYSWPTHGGYLGCLVGVITGSIAGGFL